MNNELIKRYIYAVTCNLSEKTRPEVEKELENMIAELLEARCGDAEPTEDDIRAVLTELGSPEELAVKYSGDENKALISGIYLLWFKKIIKIVLPIAAAATAFAILLSGFTGWHPADEMYGTPGLADLIVDAVVSAASAAIQVFMYVLIIFIILEHKKVNFRGEDFLNKLPPVPVKQAQIKIHDPIINILWHIAAAVLLLGFPNLIGAYADGTGWIPAFDANYIRTFGYLVLLWMAFGIAREIFKLIERRYSKKLALVTIVANVLTGITAMLFFSSSRIMNPEFVTKVGFMIEGIGVEEIGKVLANVNLLILVIMVFALILDIGLTAYRAFRYDSTEIKNLFLWMIPKGGHK